VLVPVLNAYPPIYWYLFTASDYYISTGCTCLRIRISDWDESAEAMFQCATAGTFEGAIGTWGVTTGPNNVIAVSAVTHEGTQSAEVTATGVPTGADALILECTATVQLASDTIYVISGWVFEEELTPFTDVSLFDVVKGNPLAAMGDATLIYQKTYDPLINLWGAWVEVVTIFRTGSAGPYNVTIPLEQSREPLTGGIILVDDISLTYIDRTTEAISQCIEVCPTMPCSIKN